MSGLYRKILKFYDHSHEKYSQSRFQRSESRKSTNFLILVIVAIMILSSIGIAIGALPHHDTGNTGNGNPVASYITPSSGLNGSSTAQLLAVPVAANSVSSNTGQIYNGNISVLVTFNLSHRQQLNSLLSNLSNPESAQYHKYLSRSQFESEFAPSANAYQGAINYFTSYSGVTAETYGDHVSVLLKGPASQIGAAFNTSIAESSYSSKIYYATSVPSLPYSLADHISMVSGLSNSPVNLSLNLYSQTSAAISTALQSGTGYPQPILNSGTQLIYGSDLQVAYDEQSLLNVTYPTNQVIATLLWSGQNLSGTNVGPFNPTDIYTYFNATLPSYEPHPHVYGVPINGAPKPGPSAQYDQTGANIENTLDIEMAGSTAPGANIYNVYGPASTTQSLTSSLAFILNPNATYSALNNVSVITNSWGSTDTNNSAWYTYMQEAAARGITVLAASGDSGSNSQSTKYTGSMVEFPSTMGYNSFGVTAVGGDTLTLLSNLHIKNEIAWYESSSYTGGNPAGSTGGISSIISEPSWQLNTEANNLINGQGRAVPDVSAIANNTILYISLDGTSYYGNPSADAVAGTSVASPVLAGLVAEMDAVMNHFNQSNLGYLNPSIYRIANEQIQPFSHTNYTGYGPTGQYNSTLPMAAFYDVTQGRNHLYSASFGYDLVTGWGSVDAYNLTMYLLHVNYEGRNFAADGVENVFNLTGLNVTSYYYNYTTGSYSGINTYYNASIQQNLFLADALGAPIYWIQNVIYINGSQQTGWVMNYTGWVNYPFYGQYYNQVVFEYNQPLGKIVNLPHEFVVKSWLSNLSTQDQQTMNFQVNSQVLQIPVPAASFIIGAYNYTYYWQGKSYLNGPYPATLSSPNDGGLSPQFGLVGGPSLSIGVYKQPTAGNLSAYIEPAGTSMYIRPDTEAISNFTTQTGERSLNLNWVKTGQNTWNLSILNGSSTQGVLSYLPQRTYNVTVNESGLPAGTEWNIHLGNGQSASTTESNYSFQLFNGTYTLQASTGAGYYSSPSVHTFTVDGNNITVAVTFLKYSYNVTFIPVGLPAGLHFVVTFGNRTENISTSGGSATSAVFKVYNGTYGFSVSNLTSYYTEEYSGTVHVNGQSTNISISFEHYAYISGALLPGNASIYINGNKISTNSGNFNVSVTAGNYTVIAKENGYDTYYNNLSLNPGQSANLQINLNPIGQKENRTELIEFSGFLLTLVIISGAILYIRRPR